MRDCTCLGACKGKEGLAPGWRCALETAPEFRRVRRVYYPRTIEALKAYDEEPTSGNMDLVLVAFWLEASTKLRGHYMNGRPKSVPQPTLDQIRAHVLVNAEP